MSFQPKKFKDIEYWQWASAFPDVPAKVGETALIITPHDIHKVAALADELHEAIRFDGLRLLPGTGGAFDDPDAFVAFAPYVKDLNVSDSLKRFDFAQVECLQALQSLVYLAPRPKGLRLSAFPSLRRAALGSVDQAGVLLGASSLERLSLSGRSGFERLGWDWIRAMTRLNTLGLVGYKDSSLAVIPQCPSVNRLTLYAPTGLTSLEGIEAFPMLREIKIESAKNIRDYSALTALPMLEDVVIFNSGKADSLDFLQQLPLLTRAMVNSYSFGYAD